MAKDRGRRHQAARRAEQRTERRARQHARQSRRRTLYIIGSGIFAVAIIISFVLPSILPGGTGGGSSRPGVVFPDQGAAHIPEPQTSNVVYNSVPPTSGPHWDTPADWGISAATIPNERQIHNLEHGGIMVQYKSDDQALIKQLEEFAKRQTNYPCYLIVAPYPTMDFPIAVTAWGVRDTMPAFDEARLQAFVEAYRNKGPEKVACTP